MRHISLSIAAAALAAAALAGPVAASGPTRTVEEIPSYTLADALADYAAFGDYALDCGDFHVISTFAGSVAVTDFGDRMLRQVSYEGRFYNVSDLSKSAGRIGRTATWREFDAAGNLTQITIHGMGDRAVLADGGSIQLSAGIRIIDFSVDPPSELVHGRLQREGAWEALCDALR